MGCDIHVSCEKRVNGKWGPVDIIVFDWRSYGLFGFLANVRNYSFIPSLSDNRGIPDDACETTLSHIRDGAYHSCTWLSIDELLLFDYEKTFEDRRTTAQIGPNAWSGAADAGKGNGSIVSFRDFLGCGFFEDLERAKAAGVERIIMGFDS